MTLFFCFFLTGFGGGLVGLTLGWLLFRSERTYQQGWNAGRKHGRAEGFRIAIMKTVKHYFPNPHTDDLYDK